LRFVLYVHYIKNSKPKTTMDNSVFLTLIDSDVCQSR